MEKKEKKEMRKQLKKLNLNPKTIANYVNGFWGIPNQIKEMIK